jgi:hypothetical protein
LYRDITGRTLKLLFDVTGLTRKVNQLKIVGAEYFDFPWNGVIFMDTKNSTHKIVNLFTSNPKKARDISKKRYQVIENNLQAEVSKVVVGSGLHREVKCDFKMEIHRRFLRSDTFAHGCVLGFEEFLSEGTYVDAEEMQVAESSSLQSFSSIDIEKPTEASPQHLYIYLKKFEAADLVQDRSDPNRYSLIVNFKYPIHFRYPKPGQNPYGVSYVHAKPRMFISCLDRRFAIRPQKQEIIDDLLDERFGNQVHRIQSPPLIYHGNGTLAIRDIPTANSDHVSMAWLVTTLLNMGGAALIAMAIWVKK